MGLGKETLRNETRDAIRTRIVGGYYFYTDETDAILDLARGALALCSDSALAPTWLPMDRSLPCRRPSSIIQLGDQAKEMEYGH